MALDLGRVDDAEAHGRDALVLAEEMDDRAVKIDALAALESLEASVEWALSDAGQGAAE
jgi:hypothetical protein